SPEADDRYLHSKAKGAAAFSQASQASRGIGYMIFHKSPAETAERDIAKLEARQGVLRAKLDAATAALTEACETRRAALVEGDDEQAQSIGPTIVDSEREVAALADALKVVDDNHVVPDTWRIGLVLPNYRNPGSHPDTSVLRHNQK